MGDTTDCEGGKEVAGQGGFTANRYDTDTTDCEGGKEVAGQGGFTENRYDTDSTDVEGAKGGDGRTMGQGGGFTAHRYDTDSTDIEEGGKGEEANSNTEEDDLLDQLRKAGDRKSKYLMTIAEKKTGLLRGGRMTK